MRDLHQIAIERQTINDTIRGFFRARGYVEVDTPILVASPDMEPALTPFETVAIEGDGTKHSAALITSPEYSMKKLLGTGLQKIFTLTHVFRNVEEFGGTHNPEFTMLEWYQQGADYDACMDETEALVREVVREVEKSTEAPMSRSGLTCFSPSDPFRRARVRDLMLEHAGVDLDSAGVSELREACRRLSLSTMDVDTESDLFYRLFLTQVESKLIDEPTFVYDYPRHQAALSRLTPDGKYGKRFELYAGGLELCNGFSELTDGVEQRSRFEKERQTRKETGKTMFPIDEDLLVLLPSVRQPTFGNALGVDRLHMYATGRKKLEDVLLFPANGLFKSASRS